MGGGKPTSGDLRTFWTEKPRLNPRVLRGRGVGPGESILL